MPLRKSTDSEIEGIPMKHKGTLSAPREGVGAVPRDSAERQGTQQLIAIHLQRLRRLESARQSFGGRKR
jgi:hypothetical protein